MDSVMPTAHSRTFFKERIVSSDPYVWPSFDGSVGGESIEPLHKGVISAAAQDEIFYMLLANVDIIKGRKGA